MYAKGEKVIAAVALSVVLWVFVAVAVVLTRYAMDPTRFQHVCGG